MQDFPRFSRLSVLASFIVGFSMPAAANDVEHITVTGHPLTRSLELDAVRSDSLSPDLRDTLLRLPGVNANGNGPLTAIMQYRGLYGSRVLVNVDGAPVVGAGPNGMDPPLSNLFATPGTRVTLYRGIAPVAAGAETLGGALDLTRDYDALFSATPAWRGALTVQRQDQGETDHIIASLGYHSDSVFVQGFAADQHRDDIEDGNGRSIPNSFYDRSAYGVLAGWRAGNHQLSGFFQNIDTDETGTPALAMDINYIDSDAFRLHYQWQNDNTGTFELKVFGNNNEHGMDNVAFRPATMPMRARLNTVESKARGAIATWQQALAEGELRAGAELQTAEHDSVITNPLMNNLTINNFNNVERDLQSLFAQWQGTWDSIAMTTGVRYTQVDADAGEVSNSMAAMNPAVASLVNRFNDTDRSLDYQFIDAALHLNGSLTPKWRWDAALAQKGRAPSYTELFVWLPLGISAGLADGRNYLGNLALQDERARQVDLGLTYQDESWSVAPRLFYQTIDNFIVGSPSTDMTANMISTMMTGRPPLMWINADATLYGMDMLVSGSLTPELSIEATATFTRGDRDDLDEPLYRVAPATLLTRLIWQQSQWQLTLESELVANQTRISAIQDELQSAGYGIVNGSVQYQVNQYVVITAVVNNLLDKAYQPHLGAVNRVAGIEQPTGERLFASGRNASLQVSLSF